MLIWAAPPRRSTERGQALLATLFILGFMGLLTIAVLGYAASTQGQYARTEQTAKQSASLEGAVDAGLVTAGRYPSLSSCSGTPTGSMTFADGTNGAAAQFFPSPQTLNFTYKNCYRNGAASGTPSGGAAGHGLLEPACVVCTLFNVNPSLTVAGGSKFEVAGPIWANDSISVQGAGSLLKSTAVTWRPSPSTCSSDPGMLCVGAFSFSSSTTTTFTATSANDMSNPLTVANTYVGQQITAGTSTGIVTANGTSGGFTVAGGWTGGTPAANTVFGTTSSVCSGTCQPNWPPKGNLGAPPDPLTGFETPPPLPSGQVADSYTCTTTPCPAIPLGQRVFSKLQVSSNGATLTLPGGTYIIEEPPAGGSLSVTSHAILTAHAPFTSSVTTTFNATTATDTSGPAMVANSYVGTRITAGASTGTILTNNTTGGFALTAGGWTGGTPAANTIFSVATGPFSSSGTTTFLANSAKDASSPATVANSYAGAKITAGASTGIILTNDTTGGFTLTAAGWTGGTPAVNAPFNVTAPGPTDGSAITSSGTTTFGPNSAKDTSNPATLTNSYVGAEITAGTSKGVVTANDTTGGFTVAGGWTGGTPAANTVFYTGGVTLFITCSGYNGTSFSCPASYKTTVTGGVVGGNTNTFLSVTGQGQLNLSPPTTFPETLIFEDPTVGGNIGISGGTGIPGTIYTPDAQLSISGQSVGNYGLIVAGTANLSGGGCGGCAGEFGTIPGIGLITAGTCPTFDVTATADNVSSQYGRALIQTQYCLSPSNTLGIVNFSYLGGSPP
jgi:hypothetical protein